MKKTKDKEFNIKSLISIDLVESNILSYSGISTDTLHINDAMHLANMLWLKQQYEKD